ncbi:MAG: hypothetical protein EB150_05495 [Nitrososphaeria archaeon]|nr:hypothetical protein [Nitrososphaeria archaeon]NDB50697.1 hypothetical protein [Nitrosopumilaceae archaeon]NDB89171.1 hypothetical protein [Nitrososphaerota archaeon]NDB46676.1 hypothetical protein [Nitrososphaeria archaeon]NDB62995.1 hypothetical protein [Nitrosopumilaceae archaeon]
MLKLVALMAISVLLSVSIITAVESGQYAEAMKSQVKKIHRHHYSYWFGNDACGDKLCDGASYTKWHQKYRTHTSPYDTYTNPELLKIKGQ